MHKLLSRTRNLSKYLVPGQHQPYFVHSSVGSKNHPNVLQRCISTTSSCTGMHSKWVMPYFKVLKKRHDEMVEKGLVPVERRSTFIEWNLDAELYAFGKRLNDQFDQKLLLKALLDRSHIVHQELQQHALGLQPTLTHQANDYELYSTANSECNEALSAEGRTLILEVCQHFVSNAWPSLPQEGVQSVVQHLCSENTLAAVAQGIGLKDLLFVEPYPPTPCCMSRAACAIVAALAKSSGRARACAFVVDTVVAHLVGKTIWDMWQVEDPLSMLSKIMSREGSSIEPRLVQSAGCNTLEAVYRIALYDENKIYLAAGYGETVEVATQEAAREVLSRLFGVSASSAALPFPLSLPPPHATIPHSASLPPKAPVNPPLTRWTKESSDSRFGNIVVC